AASTISAQRIEFVIAAAVCRAIVFSNFRLAAEYDASGALLARAMIPTVRCPARRGAQMSAVSVRSESSARGSEAQLFTISATPRSRIDAAKREPGNNGPA